MRSYVILSDRLLACVRIEKGASQICLLDYQTSILTPLEDDRWQHFSSLCVSGQSIYCIAGSADQPASILKLDPARPQSEASDDGIIATSKSPSFAAGWYAHGEGIEFNTRDGLSSYGYFYAPTNPNANAPTGEKPPLLVLSHGGPTAATDRRLNLRIQYYTSRGWAVFDANYSGSTGYGRSYRERLNGRWGIADVFDCVDAVNFLVGENRIDPLRVAIKGGSAGGYTTLAALTYTDCFKVGASHYGIGDLEALAKDTHKFESHYLDTLVGRYPEDLATYHARSPIHHADKLNCPVIFFQGLEDKVVPPQQAEAMVDALKQKSVPVAYVPFEGEQHGFRQAKNIRRAIENEYLFFARILGFAPADNLPNIDIFNLD